MVFDVKADINDDDDHDHDDDDDDDDSGDNHVHEVFTILHISSWDSLDCQEDNQMLSKTRLCLIVCQ